MAELRGDLALKGGGDFWKSGSRRQQLKEILKHSRRMATSYQTNCPSRQLPSVWQWWVIDVWWSYYIIILLLPASNSLQFKDFLSSGQYYLCNNPLLTSVLWPCCCLNLHKLLKSIASSTKSGSETSLCLLPTPQPPPPPWERHEQSLHSQCYFWLYGPVSYILSLSHPYPGWRIL